MMASIDVASTGKSSSRFPFAASPGNRTGSCSRLVDEGAPVFSLIPVIVNPRPVWLHDPMSVAASWLA
jgi:hypothetical protein